jgi:hypothetical protein
MSSQGPGRSVQKRDGTVRVVLFAVRYQYVPLVEMRGSQEKRRCVVDCRMSKEMMMIFVSIVGEVG